MLSLSKKTDYALIALAYLAQRSGRVSSAREIAASAGPGPLPLPLLMNILKTLHQHGYVSSTRGAKGGYQISADLNATTLHDLISILKCSGPAGECGCLEHDDSVVAAVAQLKSTRPEPAHAPVRALHYRLERFLRDVKLSDLILPGRRIDVPLEAVAGRSKRTRAATEPVAAEVEV